MVLLCRHVDRPSMATILDLLYDYSEFAGNVSCGERFLVYVTGSGVVTVVLALAARSYCRSTGSFGSAPSITSNRDVYR